MRFRKSPQQLLQITVRRVLECVADDFSQARHIFFSQYSHTCMKADSFLQRSQT
ncbi:MAG: hypothetical protein V1717_02350 [Candidatus Micrarchaeota archaeon]